MKWTWLCSSVLFALAHLASGQASSPPTTDRLVAAVLANDVSMVESMLARGVRPDATRDDGITALMLAASGSVGRPNLGEGPSYRGNSPLFNRQRNDIPVMAALLARGANINARDALGRTALWWSGVYAGKVENVKFLLERGADVNAVDKAGSTVLATVVTKMVSLNTGGDTVPWNTRLDAVRALIAARADVNVRNQEGNPILMVAMWRDRWR